MFELIQRLQDAVTVVERLLPRDDDIAVSHGISGSGRRGYAAHTTNIRIEDADIKWLAIWRAIEASAGSAASLREEKRRDTGRSIRGSDPNSEPPGRCKMDTPFFPVRWCSLNQRR
jgi:hypothetical protein